MSPPVPLVPRFVHGAHKLRKARGFSLGELKQAGVLKSQARSMGIRVDERRSTIHPQNVTALTTFLARPTQETAAPQAAVETPAVVPETKKGPERPKRKAKPSAKSVKKRKR
jgi:large subunit ribosomal protein L13e